MHQFRPWTRMKGSMLSLDFWKPNATTKYQCIYHIDSFLSQVVSSFWNRTDPAGKHGREVLEKSRKLTNIWVDFSSFQWNFSGPPPWLVIGQVSLLKRLERFGFERWRIHSQKTRCDVGDNLKSCYFCEQIWRWGSQNIVVLKSLFL